MYILGINAYHGDAAAALIDEGKAEFIDWETARKQIAEQISSTNVYNWVDWNRALT